MFVLYRGSRSCIEQSWGYQRPGRRSSRWPRIPQWNSTKRAAPKPTICKCWTKYSVHKFFYTSHKRPYQTAVECNRPYKVLKNWISVSAQAETTLSWKIKIAKNACFSFSVIMWLKDAYTFALLHTSCVIIALCKIFQFDIPIQYGRFKLDTNLVKWVMVCRLW